MSNLFIILGNGFTIDFLDHFYQSHPSFGTNIDVSNLFANGDKINAPWRSGMFSLYIT